MDPEPVTFDDHVLRIADRFLQTVVVVDDRVFGSGAPSRPLADDPDVPPGGRAVHGQLEPPSGNSGHDLDAKELTDAFARAGLICGLLEPRPEAEIDQELLQTARRADLIVMDWVLDRDGGRKALDLIRQVLAAEAGQQERQRLRTIAIYTGEPDLHGIAAKLREVIEDVYLEEELKEHENGLALTKGPVRAAVFAKENTSGLTSELSDRRVAVSDLPMRLRREFASLTDGLVTSVALAALAALRDDTHRILKVLSPGLDAAYLGHRSAQPVPREAEGLAVTLVANEMASVIEDHDADEQVDEKALFLWLDRLAKSEPQFGELLDLQGSRKVITVEQVRAMLHEGLGTEEGLEAVKDLGETSKNQWRQVKKQATRMFARTIDEAGIADAKFAQCMTLKTTYSRPDRTLQLGTIVLAASSEYLVCVQPVCDSVRLGNEVRAFPFLRLVLSDGTKSHFVVPGRRRGEWQHLLLTTNPRDIVMARFKPRKNHDTICAVAVGSGYVFKDTSNKSYRWVCQLKAEFAQKIAVDLAQEFAQVAVNDVEMLRLSRR